MKKARADTIETPETVRAGITLRMVRFDLYDKTAPGNKFFKLRYNLETARRSGFDTLLTFGGPYSNHIAATASTGKKAGIKTIGVIRGQFENLSHTLLKAREDGMILHFVSRTDFAKRTSVEFLAEMEEKFGKFYMVPEGGANQEGVLGAMEMAELCPSGTTHFCVACGTGSTLAGIINGMKEDQHATGFPVLKGMTRLEDDIRKWLARESMPKSWVLTHDYHFGGYAKKTPLLTGFMKQFHSRTGIELDFVYTAKMMFGVMDLVSKNYFPEGSVISAIHSGGLQGNSDR